MGKLVADLASKFRSAKFRCARLTAHMITTGHGGALAARRTGRSPRRLRLRDPLEVQPRPGCLRIAGRDGVSEEQPAVAWVAQGPFRGLSRVPIYIPWEDG